MRSNPQIPIHEEGDITLFLLGGDRVPCRRAPKKGDPPRACEELFPLQARSTPLEAFDAQLAPDQAASASFVRLQAWLSFFDRTAKSAFASAMRRSMRARAQALAPFAWS